MKLHNAKDLATVGAQIVEGRFRAGVFPHPVKRWGFPAEIVLLELQRPGILLGIACKFWRGLDGSEGACNGEG
ncbi:hypothetical protein AB3X94_42330, partial [Paraburkholderia sp. BR10923]|uniref:hypothetical protein n=1 Tax=Paraburkholderia sp. BR10923 TaxID=3236992 RepID=UPI0034CE1806